MEHTKLFVIAGAIAVAFVGVIYFDSKNPAQADWKTYTNEIFGFTFKYPSEFINTYTTAYERSAYIKLSKVEAIPELGMNRSDYINIEFLERISNKSIEESIPGLIPAPASLLVLDKGYKKIGSHNVKMIIYQENNKYGDDLVLFKVYAFENAGRIYVISELDNDRVVENIIKEFNFIEPAASRPLMELLIFGDTSDWKIYRDVENGFELRYPSYLNPIDAGALIVFRHDLGGAFTVAINAGAPGACQHFEGDVSEERVSISGTEAWKVECGTMVEYTFLPPHSNFFIGSSSQLFDREIFDKVLTTFKFIEP